MKKIKLIPIVFFLAITVAFFNSSAANAAIFIKIGDIKGEATDKEHKDWIDVLSWVHQITVPSDRASGLPTGKRQHSPIKITKQLDKASPKLAEACASGETFPEVEIEFTRKAPDGSTVHYFTVTLKNCIVTSYSTGGPDDNDRLTENVTLNYTEIEWKYVPTRDSFTDRWVN